MRRIRATVVAAAMLAVSAAAGGQELVAFFNAQAELERRLLTDDLRRHGEARRRETQALHDAADLQGRLDAALGTQREVGELEALDRDAAAARAAAAEAGEEAGALRRTIYERRRRLVILAEAAAAASPAQEQRSVLDGSWDVRLLPMDHSGVFELRVDGTLVSGGYRMAGGRYGSFRGTWAGGTLRLERIDSEAGFDSILEARLAPGGRRLDGTWSATLLNSAGPAGGTWMAIKREPRARE
jgi:hypothetical protein